MSGPICPQGYKPQTDQRSVTYENYKKLDQCAKNCTADNNCKGFRLKPSNEKKPLSKGHCYYNPRALGDPAHAGDQLVCIKGIT